jgi:hypothetical protein
VDAKAKTFGTQHFEILGLVEGYEVGFQTLEGKDAETGYILQCSPERPHALEISISHDQAAQLIRKMSNNRSTIMRSSVTAAPTGLRHYSSVL